MTTQQPAGTRPSWVDDELFPFESRFVTIDGHPPLRGRRIGANAAATRQPDLVVRVSRRHPRPAGGVPLRRTRLPRLRAVLARPGYRYLPEEHAQIVTAFVDAVGLSGATLVAHDWGGPVGLATVQQRPAAFEGLVLANTWAWPIGDLHIKAASHLFGNPLGRLLVRQLNLFVNAHQRSRHLSPRRAASRVRQRGRS